MIKYTVEETTTETPSPQSYGQGDAPLGEAAQVILIIIGCAFWLFIALLFTGFFK